MHYATYQKKMIALKFNETRSYPEFQREFMTVFPEIIFTSSKTTSQGITKCTDHVAASERNQWNSGRIRTKRTS